MVYVSQENLGTPSPFAPKKTVTTATTTKQAKSSSVTTVSQVNIDVYESSDPIPGNAFLSLGITPSALANQKGNQRTGNHGSSGPGTSLTTDTLSFPFNPNELVFNYVLNKQSFDTYGGRVTQLLSVKIDSMILQIDAGSRVNLVSFYQALKTFQTYQIEHQLPMKFTIPSNGSDLANQMLTTGGLTFYVWLRSIDVGWDVKTTSNPFSLTFEVEDSSYEGYYNGASQGNGYQAISKFIGNVGSLFDVTSGGIGYSAYLAGMPSLPGIPGAGRGNSADYAAAGISTAAEQNAASANATGLGMGNPYVFN